MKSAFLEHVLNVLKIHSQKSTCLHKHAAALVDKNTIVAIGKNEWGNRNATIHAEVACLNAYIHRQKRIGKDACLNRLTMVVIRYNENLDQIQNSEPCEACVVFIRRMGLKRVIYSTN